MGPRAEFSLHGSWESGDAFWTGSPRELLTAFGRLVLLLVLIVTAVVSMAVAPIIYARASEQSTVNSR